MKKNLFAKSATLALCWLLLSLPAGAADHDYTLDMRGVDIHEFINTISKMTGKTIISDSKVRGSVDIQSPGRLTAAELYEIFLVQLGVNGYSVVDAGNNILKVIPSQGAKLEGSEVASGTPANSSEAIITRVVSVQNVNANQLATTLRPLVDNRLGVIAAYDTSNVILVTDRASNVRRIAQIVEKVDKADSQSLEVIPLNNASAGEVGRILGQLMASTNKDQIGPAPQVTSDQRTNTLIVRADDSMRQRIRRIAKELDGEIQSTANTRVIYLKYAKAKDLVPVLKGVSETIIQEDKGQQGSTDTPAARQSSLRIDAHEQTNTLVMSGSPHIIKTLENIIQQLDIRRAQVMVEAVIAEVSDNASKELGVQWLFFDRNQSSSTPVGTVNYNSDDRAGIINLLGSAVSDTPSPALVGNGLSLGIGRFDRNGFSFAAFINALAKDSDSNVLSTPSLVTMDNEEAYIQVGQEIPIITGATASANNDKPFQTIERKDIGIKLKVTPQINEGDAIRLTIEQEVSSLSGIKAADIVTNKRVISTTVLVDDGATLALGGLINDDLQASTAKVPLLGDLPGIGQAFRSDGTARVKRNLMIFIRPTIIRDPQVAQSVSRQKYNYMHARQLLRNQQNSTLGQQDAPSLPRWQRDQASPPRQEQPPVPSATAQQPAGSIPANDPQVQDAFRLIGGQR